MLIFFSPFFLCLFLKPQREVTERDVVDGFLLALLGEGDFESRK